MNDDISPDILVVGFDPMERALIELTLNRTAYHPVMCQDAAKIRAMIEQHRPCILLMDLYIPGVNSIDLLRSLSHEGLLEDRAVIAVSAFAFKEVVRQAVEAGVDDFLTKPVSPDLLLARIHSAAGKKQVRR